MKTIRKNFLLLAFAAGALFLIGNNVMADDPTTIIAEPGNQGGGGNAPTCTVGGCGASQCSYTYTVGILGIGGTVTQSVTCSTGHYACCKIGSAFCFPATDC